jgi:RNA polymerase sigma-70 factor (ECF subfamily)
MAGIHDRALRDDLRGPIAPEAAAASQPASTAPLEDLDTQLMLQVQGGDRDAAATLVRRNRDRIERYVFRLVRDARTAEDLTQDVLLQALSRADLYRPTARFSTWLYRVATNRALNYLKQAGRRQRALEPAERALETAESHEATPDRQMTLEELKQQVARAVDRLPFKQRIALTLFEYEDCSYEQIAAVLETTVEAVRSLLMRARTTLRSELHGLI